MQPGRVVDKLFQEDRGGAGAAPASAGVHDVSDVGADLVEIFRIERQTPEFFSRALQRLGEVLVGVFVVGENAGVGITQRDNACAGERGRVNEMGAAQG